MKKIINAVTCLMLSSCMTNYPLTTFYVKNNSAKTINFKASIEKLSSMGSFNMTLPFTVLPKDSIIARKVNFRKGISPTEWFTEFNIFPVDSILLNDPKDPNNWISSTDKRGKPVYTFNLAK